MENNDKESYRRLVELCELWYDIPREAQVSLAASMAMKVYETLSRAKKLLVITATLLAVGLLIYVTAGNWGFAYLLGAITVLIVMWIMSR